MHFVVIVPLWLAFIIWIIKVIAEKNSSKAAVVQRTITAPDGRKVTFMVPASEPISVSIARMYPGIVVDSSQAPANRIITIDSPAQPPPSQDRSTAQNVFLSCVGLIVVVALLSSLIGGSSNRADVYKPSPYIAPAQAAPVWTPPPSSSVTPSPEKVKLKTGANIRAFGSRAGAIIRVATQGEVLMKFGEANGWTQIGPIGADRPEGWIANSTIGPLVP